MERREFINRASLSLMAATLTRTLFAESAAKGKADQKIIVGAHPWVYASTLPGFDISPVLEQIFSDVAYAGYDGVESMQHPLRKDNYTRQIGELIEKYKIVLIGTSFSGDMWDKTKHNQIYEEADLVMSNLASVKGRTFGVSVGPPLRGRMKTEEELDAQAELVKKIRDLGNGKGVVINLHNHTFEVVKGMHDLGGTLKRIPDIKLGPDLNWLLRGGVNPIDFLKKYGQQICFLHLRDQLSTGRWPEALGEGNVDFEEIGRTLKSINFSGDAVIELAFENDFTPTRPLKETLKMSREYLRKTTGM
jgi:sugar phosphate isomerase/epimerase